ncbi:Bud-site selection protein [Mycena galopus ATCC 62051]|nr:Bud-site selection protein [Mycena galopus ATCC 62051]
MDASSSRGTKRKRQTRLQRTPPPNLPANSHHHELKEVRKASKKARTFETQRVVKKLKGVRKKDPAASEIAVLEAELEELKTIDPDAIGATALRTRLLKDRHISDSAPARAAIERELPPGPSLPSPTNSKVHVRLLSARALGAAVGQTVADLRAVLLPPPDAAAAAGAGVATNPDEDDDDDDEEDAEEGEDEDEDEGDAEVDATEDDAGWESGSVNGEDEDEDGWESGSVHSDSDDAAPPSKKKATKSAPSASAKPAPAASSKTAAKATSASAAASQFLPSLAVGYVRGGSDDSDVEEDAEEAGGERKNRRGQRARRAIWEKKYGRGANHKKKEAEDAAAERAVQKAKWEARQAKRDAAAGKWREGAQVADAGWGGRNAAAAGAGAAGTGAHGRAGAGGAKPQKEVGLHPSWAAKKALKEKMGSGILPSQGKKIVFD